MDQTTSTTDDASTPTHPRVRADLAAGSALIATVIVGNALWRASGAGILTALGAR